MKAPQRIGVLTAGGDCPGLNAVIRAVSKNAIYHDMEVLGIEDGFLGLIENRIRPLDYEDVSNILTVGGTILGASNKANPRQHVTGFDEDGEPVREDVTADCLAHLDQHGIEALVVIGGDGSMAVAADLVDLGVPCVGVPKTIDNDVWGTEITFGFLTAVDTATRALDRIHTTAASHHRAMVVEVMGRNAGWIALHAGVASGSDVILIPEIPFRDDKICEVVEDRSKRGKRFTVICVAEGARPRGGEQVVKRVDPTSPEPVRLGGVGQVVADEIEECTGIESRHVVLGHVQRGGSPVPRDRVLSTLFGSHAAQLLRDGRLDRMVAWQRGGLLDIGIREPAGRQRLVPPDDPLVGAARRIFTSFGD